MDDVTELLLHMVSMRSESRHESELAQFLAQCMSQAGLDAEVDAAGNAVGRLGEGPNHLVLLGHMDTVPGGPAVRLQDGKLYGRGAVDAKGPLAVFLCAVQRLVQSPPPGLRIDVVGAVEEEISTSKGARHVAQRWRPDACIIGEPSAADALTLGYKGRLLADLLESCPTAHSAGPQTNATQCMVDQWQAIQELAWQHNDGIEGPFGQLQTELQSMRTLENQGDLDRCRATVGFRLPPSLPPEVLQKRLRDLLGNRLVATRGAETAWVSTRRGPLVAAMGGAIRQVFGRRPRFKHKTGTSDMNVVGPVWQCPILAYGPGDSSLDHTPDEHVELAELRQAVDVLEAGLRRYASLEASVAPGLPSAIGEGTPQPFGGSKAEMTQP